MWHESKEIQQRDGVRLPWDTLSSYGLSAAAMWEILRILRFLYASTG